MKRVALLVAVLAVVAFALPATAQSLFERCEKQKADINAMKAQLPNIDNDINSLEVKIQKIRKRLGEFEQKKAGKLSEKMQLTQQIGRMEADVARSCRALQQCERFEKRIEDLKQRSGPIADTMRAIQNEIRERVQESQRLNGETDKLEAAYAQLNCDNLVPGQTAQATIDRCSDLFSEWNKLQADINRHNDLVTQLRNRYSQAANQLNAISQEISRLLAQMRGPCSHSARIAELEGMERDQHQFKAIKADLDDMDSKSKRFKVLKIKKPKMGKPVIRPK